MNRTLLSLSLLLFSFSYAFSQKQIAPPCYDAGRMLCKADSSWSQKNGNGSLGQIYNQSACGLNYCAASVMTATRYSPPGTGFPATLNISCLPACFSVLQAYIWWSESSSNNSATATITPPGGGSAAYAATLAGSAGSKCWPAASTRVFRANVTASITTNGNYTISISSGSADVDGITLFIIYTDPTATYQGSLVIDDGAMSIQGGAQSHTMTGFTACGPSTYAKAFAMGGDMQNNVGATHSTTLNGVTSSFPQNFWNFDEAVTTVNSGQSSSAFGFSPPAGDCWVFVGTGLYFQTTSCVVCTPSGALTTNTSQVNVACGMCNGSATVGVSGGASPYTYAWNAPGSPTTPTATGLCAGSYSVTVTDASGCNTAIQNYTIIDIGGSVNITPSATPASCFNGCNGTVSAVASGGTAPYTYNWPALGPGQNQTNVCAGTFTVNVTDANGCTGSATADVLQPNPIDLFAIPLDETCAGNCDGQLFASVTGGTGPFTYTWNNGIGVGQSQINICPGTYTVTVIDANGCVEQNTFNSTTTINAGPAGSAGFTYNGNQCVTGNSYIFTNTGTPGITYSWNFGDAGTSSLENPTHTYAAPGTYNVTQTVTNGSCSETYALMVTVYSGPGGTVTGSNISCAGNCDGSANLTPAGGSSPYTFSWSNSASTEDISSLCVGTYTVTITDASGCTGTASVGITGPSALGLGVGGTNILCNGSCTGTAIATPTGGLAPYTYAWDDPGFQNTQTATNLCAGTVNVTVTDAGGCTVTGSYLVIQPAAMVPSLSAVDASCGLSDGSVSVTVSGGMSPFTYIWSNGCTTSSCTGLPSGTYMLSVSDANGCTAAGLINVNDLGGGGTASAVPDINLSCFGVCNGQATASISGGTPPFTYLWSDPGAQTTPVATGLCAGSFGVSITDGIGCTSTASVTITQPAVLNASVTASSNALCFGACDGSATVSVSGGTSPYTYLWNNPGTSSTAVTSPDLCAGTTYTVSVTDANGCLTTATASISEPSPLTASVSGSDVLCNGGSSGAADLTATGGTGAYNYSWSNAAITEDISNIGTGTYSVTVTDQNLCVATASTTINQPAPLTLPFTVADASCGLSNGSACVAPVGGSSPYSYAWSDTAFQTTACAVTLSGGSYTVTVTDNNGCSDVASITVNDIPGGNALATLVSNASGFSLCDGQASASLSSGTAPYTYSWDDPSTQSTQVATGLCAGIYCVTVTDAVGCSSSDCITITEPPPISTIVTGTDLLCNSVCNGSAALSISGGTAPYTFSWTGGMTTQNVTGLCAGMYYVTVTDANAVSILDSVLILEPTALSLTPSGTDAVCNGACDGTASVSASGGTGSMTYQWNDPSSQTAPTAFSLCSGLYTVTVTDVNGCTGTVSQAIAQPPAVAVNLTIADANCGQADGSVTAVAVNGTAPFTFLWNTACVTSTCTGLAAGSYTVTVTDSSGCSGTGAGAIADLDGPVAVIQDSTDATCAGLADGQATVAVNDGTPPYTYSWNTAPLESGSTATTLPAGQTIIAIADVNGCMTAVSVQISEPGPLAVSTSQVNPNCSGSCDGYSSAVVGGGTPPYTYLWNDGMAQTNVSASMLCAGGYGVNVQDANGCVSMGSVTLTDPPLLVLSVASSDAYCGGSCDGSLAVTAFGGTAPFAYLWNSSPQQSTQVAANLCASTYVITVTDDNGCTASATGVVGEPSPLVASISSFGNVSCNGVCDGYAQSGVSGGVIPYTYIWSNSQTTDQITNLCAGLYNLTVTDANGCTAVTSATISAPPAMLGNMTKQNVSCYGACDGQASVAVSGGSLSYTYLWNDPFLQTNFTATGLCAGSFMVSVTDLNGCSITRTVNITQPQPLSFVSSSVSSTCGDKNGSACVAVVGGLLPYTIIWNDPDITVGTCVDSVYAGVYNPVLTDGNGCVYTQPVIINDITGPTIDSVSTTDIACFGDASGTATVHFTGGTAPFSYTWKNGAGAVIGTGSSFISGLSGGTFTITMQDFYGCTTSEVFSIYEPLQMVSAINGSSNISCFGACDGSASVVVGNGTPPYSYLWTPGALTVPNPTGLCSGIINVVVTDAKGCQTANSVTLVEPAELTISSTLNNVTCNGDGDGQITVSPSGGTQPYTYLWLPSGSGSGTMAANLAPGSYTVLVTDNHQCDTDAVFTITQPQQILATGLSSPSSCGNANGQATVNASGGTGVYTYAWYTLQGAPLGQNTATATGLLQGSYSAVITDANGCSFSLTLPVTDNAGPTIPFISSTDVSCFGGNDGTADVSPIGGTLPYTFSWSNGAAGNSPTGLTAGTFTLTVTDLNGCLDTASVTVEQPSEIVLQMSNDVTVCIGSAANIGVVASGGTNGGGGPGLVYTYTWDNGIPDTAAYTVTPAVQTTYNVTVTDVNGCPASGSVVVSLYPPLTVTVTAAMICKGESATLTASVTGGNINNSYSYQWDNPTGSTTASITVSPSSSTNYSVIVGDQGCSPDTFTVATVSVNQPPIVDFLWACDPYPSALTFSSTSQAPPGAVLTTWAWDFGDQNTSDIENPDHDYSLSQIYTVTLEVTTDQGCSEMAGYSVQSPPTAEFLITQNGSVLAPSVTSILSPVIDFVDASSSDVIAWQWYFGDEDSSAVSYPDFDSGDTIPHVYMDAGIYNVLLMVRNQSGCYDTVVHPLVVESEYVLFTPNTFTPNGDGKNDYFFPNGIGIDEKTFSFYIYDRWGDMVYKSEGAFRGVVGWDGRANDGKEASQQDVYVWLIRTEDHNGDLHEYVGHVTLLQ